ncbi:stearoyl-CoA desaturase 5-like [Nasonia vitripennis]|uniref:Fatty acid desaturase domain-containing protein n=1 Tax=Nasonia vitripennis TaxID=7425 RepID=A0A7M7QLQ1_NASVI|nr:stearoyl-CoA desaturase 5-like [Nasonia vitripennis]XP_032451693.1 stearoyl-CoA desaturase 5-like [Nasonia vitripennis]
MAPDIVDGPINFPPPMKEASTAPLLVMPEIGKQISILEPDKIEKIKEPKKEQSFMSFFHRKDVKWGNVVMITILHIVAAYGFLTAPYFEKWNTFLWTWSIGMMGAFGITGGIHRYWSHRAYKANTPLKIILSICYLSAGQNSMYQWVRDHRVHHKYSETDADPHNSHRGFFFSHVGWLMLKKHPEVIKKGQQIDMSDIEADPVAAFCERHFALLKLMICFVIPIVVPVYLWNETWYWSFIFQICRYSYVLNATWSVNSFAHFFGNKPYDKNIGPVENKFVSYVSFGEGWHNYHHTFPSDYRAAEIGGGRFNTTTTLIDWFAKLGWAYDRKVPSESLVRMTIEKRGDGTHDHSMKTE